MPTATRRFCVIWKFCASHVRFPARDVSSRRSWNCGLSCAASAERRSDVVWWQICTMTECGCLPSRILKRYTTPIAIRRAQNYTVAHLCPWSEQGHERNRTQDLCKIYRWARFVHVMSSLWCQVYEMNTFLHILLIKLFSIKSLSNIKAWSGHSWFVTIRASNKLMHDVTGSDACKEFWSIVVATGTSHKFPAVTTKPLMAMRAWPLVTSLLYFAFVHRTTRS